MDPQLTLFESPPPAPLKYRLFVGIFPDAGATKLISNQQVELRDQFRLRGRFRPRNHLHVTLHHIGDYPEMPERVIETAAETCTTALASQSSFEIIFDHVKSFRGRPGNFPFVLVNPNGNEPLMKLHRQLITELAKHRLASPRDFNFVPHVTLLYDHQNVPEHAVSPVSWKVNEVVLVLSHLGETKYDRPHSWALSE